jgi:hypothetical protein
VGAIARSGRETMVFSGFLPGRMLSVSFVIASTLGLSGCFDLEQKVGLHSNGSGTYAMAVSAKGLIGEALDKHDADIDIGGDDSAVTHKTHKGDTATQTSEVAFHDLSDLKLGDETIALHVKGKTADETNVNFHRTFRIDHARDRRDVEDEHFGKDVLETMFDGHTYKFSVWLPGKIERIAPVSVGGHLVHPTVWGDRYGHTIVWTMDLSDMFLADQLDFDVDFVAKGEFEDAQSLPGRHHIHHRHHHDDDDDDETG